MLMTGRYWEFARCGEKSFANPHSNFICYRQLLEEQLGISTIIIRV